MGGSCRLFSLAFQLSEKRARQIWVRATRFLRKHTIFERFRRSYTHQNGFDFTRLREIQTIPPVGKSIQRGTLHRERLKRLQRGP
nr:MAG TPA: hypothetical protein [Caudoviricetes sp.]